MHRFTLSIIDHRCSRTSLNVLLLPMISFDFGSLFIKIEGLMFIDLCRFDLIIKNVCDNLSIDFHWCSWMLMCCCRGVHDFQEIS